ncbi:ferredoxin [Streptomyces sp. NPDC001219]
MRLSIDRDRCIGAGMCALTAPEVFDQDAEDGLVLLRTDAPPPGLRAMARLAAGLCPAAAVTVTVTDQAGAGSSAPADQPSDP